MLPKVNRASPAEITLVREDGHLFFGRLFGLLVLDLADGKLSRFAFIVSTKVDKRAVKRSQAKRRLRQAVNQLLPKIKKSQIVLVLAKKNILGSDLAMIQKEMEKILIKAQCLKSSS